MQFSVGPYPNTPASDYITRANGLKYMRRSVVAYRGKCVVHASPDDFFGGDESQGYRSRVMTNPTWGNLFTAAKAQQRRTRDYHHMFFEGYTKRGSIMIDGEQVALLELWLGS